MDTKTVIEGYLKQSDWRVKENANTGYSFSGLSLRISEDAMEEYLMGEIFTPEIRNAHKNCYVKVHDAGFLTNYSYLGTESLLIRYKGELHYCSFKELYELIAEQEELMNEEDQAYVKYTNYLEAYDKCGFVKVSRIIRKALQNNIHFVKTSNGCSLLVTDNHPLICKDSEKLPTQVVVDKDTMFTSDLSETKDFSPKINYIYLSDNILHKDLQINSLSGKDGIIGLYGSQSVMKNKLELTTELGYVLGIIIAEGCYNKDNSISFSNKNINILNRCKKYFIDNLIPFTETTLDDSGVYDITIKSSIFRSVCKIFIRHGTAKTKTLRSDFVKYNNDFLIGIVCGIIDGEGTVMSKSSVSVRMVNRDILNKMAFILRQNGISVRDTKPYFNDKLQTGFKSNFTLYGIRVQLAKDDIDLPCERFTKSDMTKAECNISLESRYQYVYGDNTIVNNNIIVHNEAEVYDITTESKTFYCNNVYSHNCVGHDLKKLLNEGLNGVPGKVSTSPPKHFNSAINIMVNYLGIQQMEAAGAQAFPDFSILLAPFIKNDKLSYKEISQILQNFVFHMNISNRWGGQAVFSNITLNFKCPSYLKDEYPLIGGKKVDFKYSDCQEQLDVINKIIFEVMVDGDASGQPFTFPIITINVTKDFDWESETAKLMFSVTGKYGLPYFQNYISSDINPEDVSALCCRLRLDRRELQKHVGGLFGAGISTGSIQVTTLNLPKYAYEAKGNIGKYYESIKQYALICKDAHERKRKFLEQALLNGLYPYFKRYIGGYNSFFSTIGVVGGNEACLNLLGKDITTKEGKQLMIDTLKYIRELIADFQEETGHLFNLEATPAESTAHKLALFDKKQYPDIITAGNEKAWYYTNSTSLPVGIDYDIPDILKHQEELQLLYNSGTVVHFFMEEKITNWKTCANLVKRICENSKIPYFSITPNFSICPICGYISGANKFCPNKHTEDQIMKYGIEVEQK